MTDTTQTPPADPAAPAPEAPAPAAPVPGSPLGETPATPAEPPKAADPAKPEGEVEKPAEPAPVTAESYTDFTLPEGFSADDTQMGQFRETAAKYGLSQEGAQAFIDMAAGQVKSQADAYAAAQTEAWTKTIDGWKAAIAADPDLGGSKSEAAQQTLAKALDEYGDAETRKAFDLTGAGWNPHIAKFVWKMASALSEGTSVPGGNPTGGGAKTLGQLFYPDNP